MPTSWPTPQELAGAFQEMRISVLCITGDDADRSTTAMFIGLHRAGVDITVAMPLAARARRILAAEGIRVLEYGISRRIDLKGIRRLRREIISYGYDIVHVFSGRALQNSIFAVRGLDVRLIAYRGTVGNVKVYDPASWFRFLNPRIDRIVCVSEAVRRFFLGIGPRFLRMSDDRPVTIYKGHDLGWYSDEPADLTTVGIPSDAFVVSCVANYRPHKGIEWLVRAMSHLADAENVHLLLVGRMDHAPLSREIAASPAADRIHRPGFRDDAPSLVAASDVFVMPSTRREGLPRALVEAMAYRVAPVVSDCGGNPELVVNGESGIVVPAENAPSIADAVRSLYENPELRRRYGAAARERIRTRFNIEDTITQTYDLYRSMLSYTET